MYATPPSDVVAILRALVADGTVVTICQSGFGLKLAATRTKPDATVVSTSRAVTSSGDNEALCVSLVEIYLEFRGAPL